MPEVSDVVKADDTDRIPIYRVRKRKLVRVLDDEILELSELEELLDKAYDHETDDPLAGVHERVTKARKDLVRARQLAKALQEPD